MFLKCWGINRDLLGPEVSLKKKKKYFNQPLLEECSSQWCILDGWTVSGRGEWVPALPGKKATAQTPRAALGGGPGMIASVWKLMAPATIHLKSVLKSLSLSLLEKIVSTAIVWVIDPHHTAHISPANLAFTHTDQKHSGGFFKNQKLQSWPAL